MDWAWWILFLPLIAFVIIALIPNEQRKLAGWLACTAIGISFVLTVQLALPLFAATHPEARELSVTWISLSHFTLQFGILIDRLSVMMLLVVTGVGSAIFYYSIEYMEHDSGVKRYFAGLSLFAFSMIGIVLSSNLLQLFIFWELVGLSSYLLIGHWYQKHEAADAGKKAFLTNRVGDFGFLIGILMLWSYSGAVGARSLDFLSLEQSIPAFALAHPNGTVMTVAMLLIFLGVMGKSAQFPLHVWLPDAMEGPTPVSALIHAATMVAAGVYLLARMFVLFDAAPAALEIIAYIGGFTALFAALHALVQDDLKRILAYSTLSQLGYMVMALGLGSSSVAMYHLTTHAFFKALLFLAAGSIIHAAETQNIFKMGGMLKKLPLTSGAFLIGAFALIGFWPASGFWSKDEILSLAASENKILFWIGTGTVLLTALYVGRTISVVFFGNSKIQRHLHEPTHKMWTPLVGLSLLSLTAGSFGIDHLLHAARDKSFETSYFAVTLATTLGLVGVIGAYTFYHIRSGREREAFSIRTAWMRGILIRKFYVDTLYDWILARVQEPLARVLDAFERHLIVQGAVNGSARLAQWTGALLKKLQTGNVQTYLALFSSGVVLMIYLIVTGAHS